MDSKKLSPIDLMIWSLIRSGNLPKTFLHECPYRPKHMALEEGFRTQHIHPSLYEDLLSLRFRRSGDVLYRPICPGCSACKPIRIPVKAFRASKSQRRVWKKNRDLKVEVSDLEIDLERWKLYKKYLKFQHPESNQSDSYEGLKGFLYTSCTETLEIAYRLENGTLIGVSIVDRLPHSLSSVYHFFDPREAKRSLGVYSVLYEIQLCQKWNLDYYHLGYWVKDSPTMHYKAHYLPHEVLNDDQWVRVDKREK